MWHKDYWTWMVFIIALAGGIFFMIACAGCAGPEVLRSRPVVRVYSIRNGSLWRKQDSTIIGSPASDGYQCMSPDDLEKLLNACTEATAAR